MHPSPLGPSDLLLPIEEPTTARATSTRQHISNLKSEQLAYIDEIYDAFSPVIGTAGNAAASITKKKKKTKIASDADVLRLPCANTRTGVVDEKKMTALLNPAGLKQWKDGKAAAFYPDTVCDITPNERIPATSTYSKAVFDKVTTLK